MTEPSLAKEASPRKSKLTQAIDHTNDLFVEIYALGYHQSRRDLLKQVNKLLSPEHKKAIRDAMKKVDKETVEAKPQ